MTIDIDKETFLELGFVRIDNVITMDELNWIREIYDEMFNEGSDKPVRKELGGKDEFGRAALPQALGISQAIIKFTELKYRKNLEIIAKTLHGESSNFRNDHAILKPAEYGIQTPWHQDQAYHSPKYRFKTINFWLPLEDSFIENGCMWFVPFTHGGGVVPHDYLAPGDSTTAMVADNQEYWHQNGIPVPCPAGSVTVHHSYCMHYAGPNKTMAPRRAYISVFESDKRKLDNPLHFPWQNQNNKI